MLEGKKRFWALCNLTWFFNRNIFLPELRSLKKSLRVTLFVVDFWLKFLPKQKKNKSINKNDLNNKHWHISMSNSFLSYHPKRECTEKLNWPCAGVWMFHAYCFSTGCFHGRLEKALKSVSCHSTGDKKSVTMEFKSFALCCCMHNEIFSLVRWWLSC